MVKSLNHEFAVKGSDLEAHAHESTATGNSWYMIVIGDWYTSREKAEAVLRKAKQALGPKRYPDARIYSTGNISPRRVLMGKVRQLLDWIKGTSTARP